MAGFTEWFQMAFFDFADVLSSPLNVSLEMQRFVLIDRQLFASFQVFGNGVINGWIVTDNGALGLLISPGVGIVNSFAIESTFVDTIGSLPPNSTGFVYVQIDNSSVTTRNPNFVFTTTPLFDSSILLASVTTSGSSVSNVDNTVRTQIGFLQLINEQIASIRHDGIEAPKIDLTQEVQGQLPMTNIANLDASKITSGILPNSVIPTIDHTTLSNIGTLTHPQLDSFAQSIQNNNITLFGQITTVNLMKLVLALKYKDTTIDQFMENLFCIIPGITPDSFIDYNASNAYIDESSNCIAGLPTLIDGDIIISGEQQNNDLTVSSSGNSNSLQIVSIPWDTDQDFQLASAMSNLNISNGVQLSPDTTASRVIESFATGVAGQTDTLYQNKLNTVSMISVTYDTNSAEGPLAGRFEIQHSQSGVFTRTFSQPQDWSSYDTLNVLVQASNSSHAYVTISLLDSTNTNIMTALLLATDEVTTLSPSAIDGYVWKAFDISNYTRNDIATIQFATDNISNPDEYFFVNMITLTSQEYLLPQGNIKLRYSTPSSVIFNTVDYEATTPTNTSIQVRVRVANSLAELIVSPYTPLLTSGQAISLTGTNIEIDITLLSDPTLKLTPVLTSVVLTILVPANQSGFTIQSAQDWNQGSDLLNIAVGSNGVISMEETNVGDIYFINGLVVNELDPYLVPISGVTSSNMPISPYQGYTALNPSAQVPDEYNPGREFLVGLYNPKSVFRLTGGDFLIADTGNDRIMEFAQDGTFVRGYASNNNQYDTSLYALTANYNPRLGVLFITFSLSVDITFADLTTITLSINGQDIQLSNTDDLVRNVGNGEVIERPELTAFLNGTAGNFSGVADNTLSIILSSDKQALITENANSTMYVRIVGNPSPATTVTFVQGNLGGLECFIGDYMYFGQNGIWSPVLARETDEGSLVYCNATINEDSNNLAPSGTPSIVEIDENIGGITNATMQSDFINSSIVFADFIIGSALYFTTTTTSGQVERKLLVAGLASNGSVASSSSSVSGTTTLLGTNDVQKLSGYVGQTVVLNMGSGLIEWTYFSPDGSFPSDAYFDDYGNVIVAESSLYPQSGRIVTVAPNGTIINLIEGGLYTKIWDIRPLPGGNIFVST